MTTKESVLLTSQVFAALADSARHSPWPRTDRTAPVPLMGRANATSTLGTLVVTLR